MNGLLIANRITLPVEPPSRILICPWGKVRSTSGDFVFDAEAATATLAAAKERSETVVDYEHQTLGGEYAAPDGKAPAAAWVKSLDVVEGEGLFANVEWTARGAELIREKEYRYLSPVFLTRKSDGRVVMLHSVALTNTPAIVGMRPIVNKNEVSLMINSDEVLQQARWFLNLPTTATETDVMNELEKLLSQIREMAGVAANADQSATLAALKAKLTRPSGVSVAICKAAGVADDAAESDVVAAINAAKTAKGSDGTDWQARCELLQGSLNKANERIERIEKDAAGRDIEARINSAKDAGKITDADINGEKSGAELRRMAADEATWNTFVGFLSTKAPVNGRVVNSAAKGGAAGGDRVMIINKARGEFDAEPDMADMTTREAYVRDALRQAGQSSILSEEEKKLVA